MPYSTLFWNSLRFAHEGDTTPVLHMSIHMHVHLCVYLHTNIYRCAHVFVCGYNDTFYTAECTFVVSADAFPSCRTADRRCQYSLTNVCSPYALTWETNCRYKSLPLLMSQFENTLNKFQFVQKLLFWSCIIYPRNNSPRGQYQNVVSGC